jgi:hypothetical protein
MSNEKDDHMRLSAVRGIMNLSREKLVRVAKIIEGGTALELPPYTLSEAAKRMGVCRQTMKKRVASGWCSLAFLQDSTMLPRAAVDAIATGIVET